MANEVEKYKAFNTEVYNGLMKNLDSSAAALPADFNRPRFVQNCMTVLQEKQNDFANCNPRSVVRTLLKGSFLGLDFFMGECYAIPYKGTVEFQTDYKGEIKLAKKYSVNPIKDIYAKLVREGDSFEEAVIDGKQAINFKPVPFNDKDIIGAFAVCLYQDGSMIYDTMSIAEVEKTRKNYSKIPNGPAWTKSYGEMVKKTVLRRLCKLINKDFESADAVRAYENDPADDARGIVEQETGSVVIDIPADDAPALQEPAEPGHEAATDGDGQMFIPGF